MGDTGELRLFRRTDEHGRLISPEAREQPADIADDLLGLEPDEQLACLRLLDKETAGHVLAELPPHEAAKLLKALGPAGVAPIVDEMDPDDAADLLASAPRALRDQIIAALPERQDRSQLQHLLAYDPETAGGLMSTDFIEVRPELTIDQAIQAVRQQAQEDAETIYYIYATDPRGRLEGVLSLRDLILAPPDARVQDRMIRDDIIAVAPETDQEEVAEIISRYDLIAVPVVDQYKRLRGIVTVDDVMDVVEEEAAEDLYSAGGVSVDAPDEDRLLMGRSLDAFKARMPWLLATCLGGILAGSVVRGFQGTLDRLTAAAMFMPLLAGMGGNVGTQTVTIVIRGLATGYIESGMAFRVVWREARVGFLLGAMLGAIVGLVAWAWHGSPRLGLVVGAALLANMTTAATMGTLTPLIFRRVGIDPAVASGPFITTSIDVVGLTIYFTLITLLL